MKYNHFLVLLGILLLMLIGAFGYLIVTNKTLPLSRNILRQAAVRSLADATRQYMIDNNGNLPYGIISQNRFLGSGNEDVDLCTELVPKYLPNIPIDPSYGYPSDGSRVCSDIGVSYNSGYQVSITSDRKILVKSIGAELNASIEAIK